MSDLFERYEVGKPFWTAAKFNGRGIKRTVDDFMAAAKAHDDNPEDPAGRREMALALALAASRLATLTAATESWAGRLPLPTIHSASRDG